MAKLTMSQVANKIGVSVYTIRRWYKWLESEDVEKLAELVKNGMPVLPKYELVGATKWRYWDENDIEDIIKFKEWVPKTRNGVMSMKKEEK